MRRSTLLFTLAIILTSALVVAQGGFFDVFSDITFDDIKNLKHILRNSESVEKIAMMYILTKDVIAMT